jgi:ribosomal peptide maturation radical SAM protein 1
MSATTIALVSMPWVAPHRPSIQLGLLRANARAAGFDVDCFHYYVELCRALPPSLCRDISERPRLGDWLFSFVFDPGRLYNPNYEDFRAAISSQVIDPVLPSWHEVAAVVEACAGLVSQAVGELVAGRYGVVGFSTMFDQTIASLCVARAVKNASPESVIVFGGANVDGVQGEALQREFDFVDVTLAGEADATFPRLLHAIADNSEPIERVPGVVVRRGPRLICGPSPVPIADLDSTPPPDYDPYFAHLEALGIAGELPPVLLMETSRGCWYGKCLFCGLNREAIGFRAKSPERVRDELLSLVERHGILSVCMVDNIFSARYFRELLPLLIEQRRAAPLDVTLFFELKANVRRDQVSQLAEAGVRRVQPGIESFVGRTLASMLKGASVHQNIQVLKWCQEFRIRPFYNILFDVPGQNARDLLDEAAMVSVLSHLEPPASVLPVKLERFSPYHLTPERFGLSRVRPDPCYAATYPAGVNVDDLAYDFVYDSGRDGAAAVEFQEARRTLFKAVDNWRASWRTGMLTWSCGPGFARIVDCREQRARSIVLRGAAAAVAFESETSITFDSLGERLIAQGLVLESRTVDALVKERLLHVENQRALFLPVRETHPELGTV